MTFAAVELSVVLKKSRRRGLAEEADEADETATDAAEGRWRQAEPLNL